MVEYVPNKWQADLTGLLVRYRHTGSVSAVVNPSPRANKIKESDRVWVHWQIPNTENFKTKLKSARPLEHPASIKPESDEPAASAAAVAGNLKFTGKTQVGTEEGTVTPMVY